MKPATMKLRLSRDTLRRLTTADLKKAVGGRRAAVSNAPTQCDPTTR